jgi:hypothetical protein
MNTIFEDKRQISRISPNTDIEGTSFIKVGTNGVTKIEAYREYGWGEYVPWLAIWKGDNLHMRTAAQGWDIFYDEDGE